VSNGQPALSEQATASREPLVPNLRELESRQPFVPRIPLPTQPRRILPQPNAVVRQPPLLLAVARQPEEPARVRQPLPTANGEFLPTLRTTSTVFVPSTTLPSTTTQRTTTEIPSSTSSTTSAPPAPQFRFSAIAEDPLLEFQDGLSDDPFLSTLPTGLREDPLMTWQQFALSQAKTTWDQDPFRKVITVTGRPTFDIDFSADSEAQQEISTVTPSISTPTSIFKPTDLPQHLSLVISFCPL
jgi:hypothetical protein